MLQTPDASTYHMVIETIFQRLRYAAFCCCMILVYKTRFLPFLRISLLAIHIIQQFSEPKVQVYAEC